MGARDSRSLWDDVSLLLWVLANLIAISFWSAGSTEHIDWKNAVGMALWLVSVGGLYHLGLSRGRTTTTEEQR